MNTERLEELKRKGELARKRTEIKKQIDSLFVEMLNENERLREEIKSRDSFARENGKNDLCRGEEH